MDCKTGAPKGRGLTKVLVVSGVSAYFTTKFIMLLVVITSLRVLFEYSKAKIWLSMV